MTDQDELRDRIEQIIEDKTSAPAPDGLIAAQAIINEFGLRVEGQMGVDGEDPIWQERVAGKWEAER